VGSSSKTAKGKSNVGKSAGSKTSGKTDKSEAGKEATAADAGSYSISSPEKVLFPDEGYTKQDLADYYAAVEERMFAWCANRPLTLVRCPAGRTKPCFYQRHNKVGEMPGIEPVVVEIKGGDETYIYMAEPEGLRTLVQQSTLEIHGWQCKAQDVERPDRMVFDIDPSPEVGWAEVVAAAKTVKELLEKCGFATFAMTTGGKGLHVVVPLKPAAGWDEVISFAEAIARFLESSEPERFTANLSKKKRVGRVFVDYLRNHKTASAVLPYSSRARPGATVATPVAWKEVTAKLNPSKFTIKTVPARVRRQKEDPWAEFDGARKELKLREVIAHLQGE
jgi:bifunctional non-homologous end joining protein LigD